jgi:hypothetical protein
MFETLGQQHAEGSVRIQNVLRIGHSNRHFFAVATGDRVQRGGIVEGACAHLANRKPNARTAGFEIHDAAGRIRALVVFQATLEPEASIASTDRRARRVDAAAAGPALMRAVLTSGLCEFVDAKHRATK